MSFDNGPKPAGEIQVCRKNDGREFTAGDEVFRILFWTDRLIFSLSRIPPGGKSPVDPGHRDADEVYHVLQGTLEMELPDLNRRERLYAGDSMLVPQDQPHTMINPGDETMMCVVVTAPHLGYDLSELIDGKHDEERTDKK